MARPRVLMIVSNGFTHDPRVSAEAGSLTKAGYEVTVLSWDRESSLHAEENREGIRIVRLRNTLIMRARGFDFFRLKGWWDLAYRRGLALGRDGPFAAIHCHDLDTLPAGVRLKEAWRVPLIYDAHEVFPYLVEQTRARRWAPKFAELDRTLIPQADLVIAAGPGHLEYLSPLARSPVVVVTNSKPLLQSTYEPPTGDGITIAYYGGLDSTRFLVPLAELATEMKTFTAEFSGGGPLGPMLSGMADLSGGHVRFLGLLPMAEVLTRTRKAHLVFAMFDPGRRLNRIGYPNKFFEALATGRPILVSRGTRIAEEVERSDVGLAVDYSKEALQRSLTGLLKDRGALERMGRNALRLAVEKYNWALEEKILLAAYERLLAAKARPVP